MEGDRATAQGAAVAMAMVEEAEGVERAVRAVATVPEAVVVATEAVREIVVALVGQEARARAAGRTHMAV